MIDQMDERMKAWATEVIGAPTITLDGPSNEHTGSGVSLYLYSIGSAFPSRLNGGQYYEVELHYLVSTWADDPEEAHRMLGSLVFAAMANSGFQLDLDPIPENLWLACAAKPRPAFFLRVPVRVERSEPPSQLVTRPLVLHAAPITSLDGLVLGQGDVPLPDARVEIPFLHLSTLTDSNGRFFFASVPSDPPIKQLKVVLKGWSLDVPYSTPSPASQPFVIRFNPLIEKRS